MSSHSRQRSRCHPDPSRSEGEGALCSESRELYIGVTNNLQRRLAEHRGSYDPDSYSSRHKTTRLVYFEVTSDVRSAIRREKRLKRLSRQRKLELIERESG